MQDLRSGGGGGVVAGCGSTAALTRLVVDVAALGQNNTANIAAITKATKRIQGHIARRVVTTVKSPEPIPT